MGWMSTRRYSSVNWKSNHNSGKKAHRIGGQGYNGVEVSGSQTS